MSLIQLYQGIARWKHRYVLPFLFALALSMLGTGCKAQQLDTVRLEARTRAPSPQKAIFYSAVLPGLGQVYNRKYWKVPIIYGAGGALAYFVVHWHTKYKRFRDAYEELYGQPDPEPVMIYGRLFNMDELQRPMRGYGRYRDLCVLGFGAIYALNIIDAMVDAHFFYYDISNDISLRIEPALMSGPDASAAFGLGFQLGF